MLVLLLPPLVSALASVLAVEDDPGGVVVNVDVGEELVVEVDRDRPEPVADHAAVVRARRPGT